MLEIVSNAGFPIFRNYEDYGCPESENSGNSECLISGIPESWDSGIPRVLIFRNSRHQVLPEIRIFPEPGFPDVPEIHGVTVPGNNCFLN